MHYAAAVFMIGVYMYNLPLAVAVIWRPGVVGIGLGVFGTCGALSRAERNMGRRKKRKRRRGGKIMAAAKLIKRMELKYFSARVLVGVGDAAATALLCGAVSAAAHTVRGFADGGKVDVRPDFSGEKFEGEVRAAAVMKLGRALGALTALI